MHGFYMEMHHLERILFLVSLQAFEHARSSVAELIGAASPQETPTCTFSQFSVGQKFSLHVWNFTVVVVVVHRYCSLDFAVFEEFDIFLRWRGVKLNDGLDGAVL